MPKKRLSPEQIISTLRQIEVHLAQGKSFQAWSQQLNTPIQRWIMYHGMALGATLHWTVFARRICAIGNNAFPAQFSGIPIWRTKFILFPMA